MKIIQNDKNSQLYYTKNNSSKIITFTNNVIKEKAKGKESPKYNLHRYIYKNNNIATKTNNKLNLSNNLILTKRTFKNTKKFFSKEKMNIINPISEFNDNNFDLLSIEKQGKVSNKISCFSNDKITKIKKIRKEGSHKYKKRKTKSQENNNCKIGINYNNNLGEFKSVEEIHFIFVYINQKKKAFFEKKQFCVTVQNCRKVFPCQANHLVLPLFSSILQFFVDDQELYLEIFLNFRQLTHKFPFS